MCWVGNPHMERLLTGKDSQLCARFYYEGREYSTGRTAVFPSPELSEFVLQRERSRLDIGRNI